MARGSTVTTGYCQCTIPMPLLLGGYYMQTPAMHVWPIGQAYVTRVKVKTATPAMLV